MKHRLGLAITLIGVGHLGLGLHRFHDQFAAMIMDALWASGAGEMRGWAFWFTYAGILMILIGRLVSGYERQGLQVPKSIGWMLLASSILGAVIYPISGFWLLVAVSLPMILARPGST